MDAPLLAARWRKEHWLLSKSNDRAAAFEAFASRSFASQDFVFALDAYAQAFALRKAQGQDAARSSKHKTGEPFGVITAEFAHNYLVAALQVQDPLANVQWERLLLAWELVRSVTCVADPGRYGDESYYKLRAVCFASFRSIYDVVFAWEDPPAQAIAQWWRASCERRYATTLAQHDAERDDGNTGSITAVSAREPSTKRTDSSRRRSPKMKSGDARRAQRSPSQSPSATTAKPLSTLRERTRASKRALLGQRGSATAISTGSSSMKPTNQVDDGRAGASGVTQSPANASSVRRLDDRRLSATAARQRGDAKRDACYENSPTKRRLSAVRYDDSHHRAEHFVLSTHSQLRSHTPPGISASSALPDALGPLFAPDAHQGCVRRLRGPGPGLCGFGSRRGRAVRARRALPRAGAHATPPRPEQTRRGAREAAVAARDREDRDDDLGASRPAATAAAERGDARRRREPSWGPKPPHADPLARHVSARCAAQAVQARLRRHAVHAPVALAPPAAESLEARPGPRTSRSARRRQGSGGGRGEAAQPRVLPRVRGRPAPSDARTANRVVDREPLLATHVEMHKRCARSTGSRTCYSHHIHERSAQMCECVCVCFHGLRWTN
ncbi:hypothetical protein PybrP1_002372 [[Pythium] brassicae (nom. inval.)]|nr:hypothetical protein PybrP1_002372 [[Pythium] brassicae (nom. inval.)]